MHVYALLCVSVCVIQISPSHLSKLPGLKACWLLVSGSSCDKLGDSPSQSLAWNRKTLSMEIVLTHGKCCVHMSVCVWDVLNLNAKSL